MTKQWLDMGLRPRAVTRDLEWGIPVPLDGETWGGKCIYVWFEAVQGYSTCARIWSKTHAPSLPDGEETWKRWWCVGENGTVPRHLYFLGKDNIPFHTVIWPALILGLNHVHKGLTASDPSLLPGPGEFALESNVPAMEYLMLAGGQFSKSRKHAIWLPSFLERFPADTLRYFLSAQMPEEKDSDFTWDEFVAKINNVLNANLGNFVHRVLTLGCVCPLSRAARRLRFTMHTHQPKRSRRRSKKRLRISPHTCNPTSIEMHSKASWPCAVRSNQTLQVAAPWKHLKKLQEGSRRKSGPPCVLLAYCTILGHHDATVHPTSAQQLWVNLGNKDRGCRSTMERRHRLVCAAYLA